MDPLRLSIAERKAELDRLRPLTGDALRHLQKHDDVELTYTSNAIEGNTLTYRETAEVIEHGITVGGKPIRDHLEAVDHYEAIIWMRDVAGGAEPIGDRGHLQPARAAHRRLRHCLPQSHEGAQPDGGLWPPPRSRGGHPGRRVRRAL